jgi:hypothetical protein
LCLTKGESPDSEVGPSLSLRRSASERWLNKLAFECGWKVVVIEQSGHNYVTGTFLFEAKQHGDGKIVVIVIENGSFKHVTRKLAPQCRQIPIACENGGRQKRVGQACMLYGNPEKTQRVLIVDFTVTRPGEYCGAARGLGT